MITVDIHSPQTEGFFSVPVDCLTARFLFERLVFKKREKFFQPKFLDSRDSWAKKFGSLELTWGLIKSLSKATRCGSRKLGMAVSWKEQKPVLENDSHIRIGVWWWWWGDKEGRKETFLKRQILRRDPSPFEWVRTHLIFKSRICTHEIEEGGRP